MKKIAVVIAVCLVGGLAVSCAMQPPTQSLRGDVAMQANNVAPPETMPAKPAKKLFPRTFEGQVPLIAHKVQVDAEKYTISITKNGCLGCHDKPNYKKEEAPVTSKTHYTAADGTEQETLVGKWYFCTQCHVVQMEVAPIVENTFVGTK